MEGGCLRAMGMTRECQVRICEGLGVKFPGYSAFASFPRCLRLVRSTLSCGCGGQRREWPSRAITGLMQCSNPASLFDHVVGAGEQRRRHVEAKRLGSD